MYTTPILLAISGGIDSMVMLDRLLKQHGAAQLAVAHCNFKLRGEESDGDEAFVRKYCESNGVKLHVAEFDTKRFAELNSLSVQEAARELRFDFFFQLKEEEGYAAVATAHHLDDSIETFFINLMRGSGPAGLSGISEDEERQLIRPLNDMTRADVVAYAEQHKVAWREDSSNRSTAYLRNRLRQELLPLMHEFKPGFDKVMRKNMRIQSDIDAFVEERAQDYQARNWQQNGTMVRITPEDSAEERVVLGSLLKGHGFNHEQVNNILSAKESGAQVVSDTHSLTKHRAEILLTPLRDLPRGPWQIHEGLRADHVPVGVSLRVLDQLPAKLDQGASTALLAAEKIKFPLSVRLWEAGDRFEPLGMRGSKKVSDFLNDAGLSMVEKREVYVLTIQGEIAWVIGHRIDERFKVQPDTRAVLEVQV